MIRIIDKKSEAKKYTDAISTLFRVYRINGELPDSKEETMNQFLKIVDGVRNGTLYKDEPVKREIINSHLLSGIPLNMLADKLCYSTSHIYNMHQLIMKDLATLFFKVVIL